MTHFSELITNRRSTRQYTDEKLQPEEVEQILKAALMSPSSKNCQAWQFVLVEDKEMLQKLSLCRASGASFVPDCALAIVVLVDPLLSGCFAEDAAIASSYIQLQAEDLGLGSCWVHVRGRETEAGQDSEDYIRDLLNIPFQLCVNNMVCIGRKAKIGKPHDEEKLKWEQVHIEQYRHAGFEE